MPVIRVSKQSRNTLNKLSELSRIPVTKIVQDFTDSIDSILDEVSTDRISLLSTRHPKAKLVLTYIGELFVGSAVVPDSVTDSEAISKIKGDKHE